MNEGSPLVSRVAADPDRRVVVLSLHHPMHAVVLSPDSALVLAKTLAEKAFELVSVTIDRKMNEHRLP